MKIWTKILTALVVVGMVGVANAADEAKPAVKQDKTANADKAGKPKAAKKANVVSGQVVGVDGGTLKIKTGKKAQAKEITVATDASTTVMIEGKAAKLADLKPGQRVNVAMAKEDGTGPAVKIAVPAPKAQKTPKGDKAANPEKAEKVAK